MAMRTVLVLPEAARPTMIGGNAGQGGGGKGDRAVEGGGGGGDLGGEQVELAAQRPCGGQGGAQA